MQRVERHIQVRSKVLFDLCFKSKNLYNYVNYILRQSWIKEHKIPREYDITKQLSEENQIDYRELPTQSAQQAIKLLYKNWKSFFKSIKEYSKNPSKFKGRPKLPKYKDKTKGQNVVAFTNQNCRIKEGFIYFAKDNLAPLQTNIKQEQLRQVRIIPNASCYVIEVVYEREKEVCETLDNKLYLGIDLGVNNLATLVSNSDKIRPLLLNGKILKSINQYYNKKKSVLMSYIGDNGTSNRIKKLQLRRDNLIDNYLHHTSRFIINYCIENKIGNIVIGKNAGWKDSVNLGKVNNQKFVYVPYEKLIQQIEYKAEEVGITVTKVGENHTSKCDSLGLEEVRHQEKYKGRRTFRGLFRSSVKRLINADVNGSLNILRKVIGDSFVKKIANRGLVFNPLMVNPLRTELLKVCNVL